MAQQMGEEDVGAPQRPAAPKPERFGQRCRRQRQEITGQSPVVGGKRNHPREPTRRDERQGPHPRHAGAQQEQDHRHAANHAGEIAGHHRHPMSRPTTAHPGRPAIVARRGHRRAEHTRRTRVREVSRRRWNSKTVSFRLPRRRAPRHGRVQPRAQAHTEPRMSTPSTGLTGPRARRRSSPSRAAADSNGNC